MTSVTSLKRAFTLVELLVGIAIIATLATFVVMGIGAAGKGAKAAKLSAQLKDIYTGMSQLSEEGVETGNHNPGSFPPHSGYLNDDQGTGFLWWDLVAEKMNVADREAGDFEWAEPYTKTAFQNPLSKHQLGGDKTEYNSLYGQTEKTLGSFTYNAELGGEANGDGDEGVFVVRISKLEDGANTIYFAECDDERSGEGYYFDGMTNAPQGNYKDRVHCCMCDGSVKVFSNDKLKNPSIYEFLTEIDDKNYNNQP
ncbi:type II secretion system GspH family protein [Akkermansiaceae bacterium]|nr:type II secretion system GspH family protein [Akkermansiaceae bacterium]